MGMPMASHTGAVMSNGWHTCEISLMNAMVLTPYAKRTLLTEGLTNSRMNLFSGTVAGASLLMISVTTPRLAIRSSLSSGA